MAEQELFEPKEYISVNQVRIAKDLINTEINMLIKLIKQEMLCPNILNF
jgi:hypothetical protein